METSHTIPIAALAIIALGFVLWLCVHWPIRGSLSESELKSLKDIDFDVVGADFEPIVPPPASVTPVAKKKPAAKKAKEPWARGRPARKVRDVKTGEVWPSVSACARDLKVSKTAPRNAINGGHKCCGRALEFVNK